MATFDTVGFLFAHLHERRELDERSAYARPHDVAGLREQNQPVDGRLDHICARVEFGGFVGQRRTPIGDVDEPIPINRNVTLPPLREDIVDALCVGIIGAKAGHGVTSVWTP